MLHSTFWWRAIKYLRLAKIVIKVSENLWEEYWCCVCVHVKQCLSLPRCVFVNVFTYLFGVVVLLCACHACARRECDACHRQFENVPAEWWHSTWASGIWAKTGHIRFGKRPRAAGTENQRSLFFSRLHPCHAAVSCLMFFTFILRYKPPGHLMAEGSQYCMKSWPSVFIKIKKAVVFINQTILCETDVMSQPVDCLCLSSACNIWKITKTIWRRWLGMSDIDCFVHRQTAVTVGFTDRELKLLYLWSQIHQTALIKTVILPCTTWELICSCCNLIFCL